MERVVAHLSAAAGRLAAGGNPGESIALARLAIDADGPTARTGREVLALLDLAARHDGPPVEGRPVSPGERFLVAARAVARTPGIALPSETAAPIGAEPAR